MSSPYRNTRPAVVTRNRIRPVLTVLRGRLALTCSAAAIGAAFWPVEAYATCTATSGPAATDYAISSPFVPPLGPPIENLDSSCTGASGNQSVEVPLTVEFDRFGFADGIASDGSAATWTLINNGAIRAQTRAVTLNGGGHTLVNNGEISGSTMLTAGQMVAMDGDGIIVNSQTGWISGSRDGVVVGGAPPAR